MPYSHLRSKRSPLAVDEASCTSTPYSQQRHATADFTESDDDLTDEEEQEERNELDEDEDEDGEQSHLLPIFSAAHLDALPVYSLTHAIRLIVLPKTETTLSWDQLRSPQVSQFLVKPMQQQIRTSHLTRATLYALMANCLQFQKEGQSNPGNAGTSKTRAMVCELLAIKLLKEFNTRELIDALSYDFFPLQGVEQDAATGQLKQPRDLPAFVRISTLEIAIRASAKRFLAQPLVIQQLESIWAGTIEKMIPSIFGRVEKILDMEPRVRQVKSYKSPKPLLHGGLLQSMIHMMLRYLSYPGLEFHDIVNFFPLAL